MLPKGISLIFIVYVSRILDEETFGYMLLGDTIFTVTLVLSNPLLDELLRRLGYRFGIQKALPQVFPIIDTIAIVVAITATVIFLFLPYNLVVIGIVAGVFGIYRVTFFTLNIIVDNPKKILKISLIHSLSLSLLSIVVINFTHFVFVRLAIMALLSLVLFRMTINFSGKLFKFSKMVRLYFYKNIALYFNRCFGIISSNIMPVLILYFVDVVTYGKLQYLIRLFSLLLLMSTGLNQSIEKKLLEFHIVRNRLNVKSELYKGMILLSIVGFLFVLTILVLSDYLKIDIKTLRFNIFFLVASYVLLNAIENMYRIFKYELHSLFILRLSLISFALVISLTVLLHLLGFSLLRYGFMPLLVANLLLFYLSYVRYFKNV